MENTTLYKKYCVDFNQNFYTYTREELEQFKEKLTPDQISDMANIVEEIFTYGVQSVTFDRPDFVSQLDKHQYFSLSSYFYPDTDPTKEWIRKDGHVNPESIMYAKSGLRKTSMVLNLGSIMYYLTGDKKYYELMKEHIKSFFLNEETKMLPNLNYAQIVVNHPKYGTGRGSGIVDFSSNMGYAFVMIKHLYDLGMFEEDLYNDLKAWTKELLVWLETHPNAHFERDTMNNHGTIFMLLMTQLYFFVGELDEKKDSLIAGVNKHLVQIDEEGRMDEELLRTRALAYSAMNFKSYVDAYKLLDVNYVEIEALKNAFKFLLPVYNNEITIQDVKVSDNGELRGCEQMEGTYPEHFKLYLMHLAKNFGLDLKVESSEDVHYKYLFL
ncbi:MAG: hypothetical protein ATN35_03405 [Epulopiscium sp. Nele67-Bin004]|nr:MAG: hypothetical protein ATN35_03405 [Epulopiscium sp. Nele67-Bin004]